MSNIVAKIRQRIALKDKNKFDLSCDHITTTDFFKIQSVYFKEMVPGENIKINCQTFTRLSPLVNPMYGRCKIVNRAFFVPMRTIFRGWNEFITDTPYQSKFLQVPLINPHDLTWCLTQAYSTEVQSTQPYDFASTGTSPKYYQLSAAGRRCWTILQSLGYRYSIGYWINNTPAADTQMFSALPLLAYAKIYLDWYRNMGYNNTSWFDGIFDWSVNNTSNQIPGTNLLNILQFIDRANYDKDYFTSAWDRPVSPNNGLNSSYQIEDVTNNHGNTTSSTTVESVIRGGTSSANLPTTPSIIGRTGQGGNSYTPGNLTQYALDALKALTDYLKRHQIAGSQAMDRMMARFGVKPSDAALNRSIYLGKDEVDVQIADVMATAAGSASYSGTTVKSALGDYAGKGLGYSQDGWFEYNTDEYGYIMIISVLQPHVGYVQGMNRANLHIDRLDFFTPEFDSLGVQAIARKELLSDYNQAESTLDTLGTSALEGVFGYTSRYAEYKIANDNLTGDFTAPSINSGLSSWHLFRLFDAQRLSTPISHSEAFCEGESAQYDRVFSMLPGTYDHFINIFHFNVESYAPMARLFDDYKFDGGSKEVNIEVNGTQLN